MVQHDLQKSCLQGVGKMSLRGTSSKQILHIVWCSRYSISAFDMGLLAPHISHRILRNPLWNVQMPQFQYVDDDPLLPLLPLLVLPLRLGSCGLGVGDDVAAKSMGTERAGVGGVAVGDDEGAVAAALPSTERVGAAGDGAGVDDNSGIIATVNGCGATRELMAPFDNDAYDEAGVVGDDSDGDGDGDDPNDDPDDDPNEDTDDEADGGDEVGVGPRAIDSAADSSCPIAPAAAAAVIGIAPAVLLMPLLLMWLWAL
jgi:hypothetical protein